MTVIGKLSEYYNNKPAIRSLLQIVPGWGSADTLLQERANEIRSERMKTFFDELAAGKHELTDSLINSEDFLHSYFCTLKAALNTRQREKIKMLARLLDASLSKEINTSTDEYEELLAVLDAISLREFNALLILSRLERVNPPKIDENGLQNLMAYWAKFKTEVAATLDIPETAFSAFMAKMERTGLYLRFTGSFMDYEGDMGRTTALFSRLLQFIS